MISKTKQKKIALKHFTNYVNETYGPTDFEVGESGVLDFKLNGEYFCVHRNYLNVFTYKMEGEKGFEALFEIECQLQEALHTIIRKVEDEIITE